MEVLEIGLMKHRVFQMLLLQNDSSQEVEVHEDRKIDFMRLWDHLEKGGSAFITSKDSQKMRLPKQQGRRKSDHKMKTLTPYFFGHI